ncbi:MAG TPA: DUF5719 family protein [Acidimicrobiales bacterium]
MSPRLPFLAIVGLAITGAALASEGGRRQGDDPAGARAASSRAAIESPAGTWFCAGGSDHTVIVTAGPERVSGRLTVLAGDHAPPPASAAAASTTTTTTSTTTTSTSTSSTTSSTTSTSASTTTTAAVGAGIDGATGAVDDETEQWFALAPGEQARYRLADLVDAPLAAAIVELDAATALSLPPPTRADEAGDPPPATVEHEVTGPAGTDTAPCTSRTAATWHFAWGATTRDAEEQLVLFNPFPNDVAVDAVFSTDRGLREPQRWQGLVVPARTVLAVDVGDDVTRRDHVAATLLVRGGRLVVTRVQTFDGRLGMAGTTVATGVPEPGTDWAFAEGRVERGHASRIVLYNPGERVAELQVVVELPPGAVPADDLDDLEDLGEIGGGEGDGGRRRDYQPEPFGVTVRPGRYEVLELGDQARVPKEVPHTVRVRSTNGVPVVAERVTGTPDPGAGPVFHGRPPLRLDTDTPTPG